MHLDRRYKGLLEEPKIGDLIATAPVCIHGNVFEPCGVYRIESIERGDDVVRIVALRQERMMRCTIILDECDSKHTVAVGLWGFVTMLAANGGRPHDCSCSPSIEPCSNGKILAG